MQQAEDFRLVCDKVADLLSGFSPDDFGRRTGFKGWSVDEILRHLHVWNRAAHSSLSDPDGFDTFMQQVISSRGQNFREFEAWQAGDLSGRALFELWRDFYPALADAFAKTDPKLRVKWVGPGMSARSSITARLMETWSHAQAIYDEFGLERPPSEGLDSVVILGINTYGWTFSNRGLDAPQPRPQLILEMPSGEMRVFGEEAATDAGFERISGSAQEFCQVVTQCRNIADTALKVEGANAQSWMAIAQCFAGPPQDPPPPGARAIRSA